ncbi:MAG: heme ABC transporter ATP-binding protein CcmA [Legionellaceae bacterium]|nr:heme ABC transporter ATP-binding protein CcmA [Legionellaceae bacterium]HCA89070.1 heme ABC transporter ATP-binding protein CcmA [Legionellales bacterium]|tara:strand:- start:1097 stop:1702 length:606 start_codon:yes stop_codon:yes gene_type:complete
MLDVVSLAFEYEDKILFQGINLSISAGTLLHVQGKNGAGKTTLLKLIAGLILPASGDIYWQGKAIHHQLNWYQAQVCYVGHKSGLCAALTVKESIVFDLKTATSLKNLEDKLVAFNLWHLVYHRCGVLSAGQKRKVALMRPLLSTTALWLLDEPFTALDKPSIALLTHYLLAHLRSGGSIVVTAHHDLPYELNPYLTTYTL